MPNKTSTKHAAFWQVTIEEMVYGDEVAFNRVSFLTEADAKLFFDRKVEEAVNVIVNRKRLIDESRSDYSYRAVWHDYSNDDGNIDKNAEFYIDIEVMPI